MWFCFSKRKCVSLRSNWLKGNIVGLIPGLSFFFHFNVCVSWSSHYFLRCLVLKLLCVNLYISALYVLQNSSVLNVIFQWVGWGGVLLSWCLNLTDGSLHAFVKNSTWQLRYLIEQSDFKFENCIARSKELKFIVLFFLLCLLQVFSLRALCLLGRHSTFFKLYFWKGFPGPT
jgi:hypothetical protein